MGTPFREQHYRDKLRFRGRGLADLERRVGAVGGAIEARLALRDSLRILELGCGYGTALLELGARYGNRVELHGLNRVPGDGDAAILARNAADRGLAHVELPRIVYGDVAGGLPFPDATFDLVLSQVAWLYFGNKIGVVREVVRVLKQGGEARIDADEVHDALPPEYGRLVEIWQDGRLIPFGTYLNRFGAALVPAEEGEYLRFGRIEALGADLVPVCQIDTSAICADWDGVKCVYRVQPADPSALR